MRRQPFRVGGIQLYRQGPQSYADERNREEKPTVADERKILRRRRIRVEKTIVLGFQGEEEEEEEEELPSSSKGFVLFLFEIKVFFSFGLIALCRLPKKCNHGCRV